MQERWHLKSITQVVLVLIVFTLTGSSVVFLKPFVFKLFGIQEIVGMKGALLYILLVFPLYQILLMVYGTLLGQFDFFWKWQKKKGLIMSQVALLLITVLNGNTEMRCGLFQLKAAFGFNTNLSIKPCLANLQL